MPNLPAALPVPWCPEAAARRCSDPSYVVEIGPIGPVRAWNVGKGRPVEPLEAVMDLSDETSERRQIEAREAAIARRWARERWGR